MLPRTLEPEFSENEEEAWAYDQMDHAAVNQAFVDDLLAGGPVGPDVLDLGTGTARIPVRLCQALPDVRVMALDAATSMLDIARTNIDLGGVLGRVQLEHADAKALDAFADGMFQTVLCNSVVHHLPDPAPLLTAARRLLEPGGRLFFRDLFRPESEAAIEALVTAHAAGEPPESQQLLRQSLHAALSPDEVRRWVTAAGLDPAAVRLTSDRHWTLDTVVA